MAKTWTISGKLLVGNLPVGTWGSATKPLAGVGVKIFANEGVRWNLWGTTTTSASGSFSITKTKDKSKRKFKIEVQFKNNDLVIYGDNESVLATALKAFAPLQHLSLSNSAVVEGMLDHVSRATYKSNWYTVFETTSKTDFSGTRSFNRDLIIVETNVSDFPNSLAHKHAIMWYTSYKLINHLKANGVPFAQKVAIKYPHNNKLIPDNVETAYASPINYCAYLVNNSAKDNFANNRIDVLLHELMHLWAYRYSRGEGGMAWQLLIHQSTHDGLQSKKFVAFHEAFAEFSSLVLTANMFKTRTYTNSPRSRNFLKEQGITGLTNIDNHEDGWRHIFNCLTHGNLSDLDFNGTGDFARSTGPKARIATPKLTVYELMKVFFTPTQLRTGELTLNTLLSRIEATDDEFTASEINKFKAIFDVNSEANYPATAISGIKKVKGKGTLKKA